MTIHLDPPRHLKGSNMRVRLIYEQEEAQSGGKMLASIVGMVSAICGNKGGAAMQLDAETRVQLQLDGCGENWLVAYTMHRGTAGNKLL